MGLDPLLGDAAWTVDFAWVTARRCLEVYGLQGEELHLVNFRQNAIFQLPGRCLTLRVYGPESGRYKAELMLAVARVLAEQDFRAVRVAEAFEGQPVEIDGTWATFWQWLPQTPDGTVDFGAFGALLRGFHEAMYAFAFPTEPFDPLLKIHRRIARIRDRGQLAEGDVAVLESAFAQVSAACEEGLGTTGDPVVLHGDAMPGNVLPTADGLALLDFDSVCAGPSDWDLVPTWIASRKTGGDARWQTFLAGYGASEDDMPSLSLLATVKQLSISVVLCLGSGTSPKVDGRIARHIAGWSNWTPGCGYDVLAAAMRGPVAGSERKEA